MSTLIQLNSAISSGSKGGVHTMVPFWGIFNFATSAQLVGNSTSSMSLSNDQVIYYPYIPNIDYTCGSFSIEAASGVAGTKARICVYTQDADGLPTTLVYSSADLDLSTLGLKTATTSFSFVAGNTYWLAVQSSGSPFVKSISTSGLVQIWNYDVGGGFSATSWIQGGATFASGAPSPGAPNSFSFQAVPLITMTKL
jgi:hypothetical protein